MDFAIKRSIRWTAWSAIKMTGICTLDARQQSWTTLQTIFRRGFLLFDDVCSMSERAERKACVSNLEARPLQSRKPEFRPDRKCGGRSAGHFACRGCVVFWKAGKKADDRRKSATGGSSRYYADQPDDARSEPDRARVVSCGQMCTVYIVIEYIDGLRRMCRRMHKRKLCNLCAGRGRKEWN